MKINSPYFHKKCSFLYPEKRLIVSTELKCWKKSWKMIGLLLKLPLGHKGVELWEHFQLSLQLLLQESPIDKSYNFTFQILQIQCENSWKLIFMKHMTFFFHLDTVWKFSNFPATLILREINFGWFQMVKKSYLSYLRL